MKILDGTFRADRHGEEPQPNAVREPPPPPSSLGKPGRKAWSHTASVMLQMGVFTQAEIGPLERYCGLFDDAAAARAAIASEGRYQKSETTGTSRSHPAIKELQWIDAEMLKYEDRFGLNPCGRAGLGKAAAQPASSGSVEQFARKRG